MTGAATYAIHVMFTNVRGDLMGVLLDSTPEMGEYSVEIRRESFYLRGQDTYDGEKRHAIHVYPDSCGQGNVEILLEDIPKIRAALDQVERFEKERSRNGNH